MIYGNKLVFGFIQKDEITFDSSVAVSNVFQLRIIRFQLHCCLCRNL